MLRTGDATVRTDGVYDITNEEYHRSDDAYSRSALWLFKQSPMHYWHRYLNPERKPDKYNPNFMLGELVHCLVLEPDEFDRRYHVMHKVNKATKAGKADYQEALDHAGDKQIVINDELDVAVRMAESIGDTDMAHSLIKCSQVEKSIYWTDEATQLQFKCRPDAWMNGIVVDVKTTKSCQYNDFQRSCYAYGYYLQASMCQLALKSLDIDLESFIFYLVEKTAPYLSVYYILDDEALDYGVKQFHKLSEDFARSKDADDWPGPEPRYLSIPNYVNYED